MKLELLQIRSDVCRALEEDIGSGDVTASLLPNNLMVTAHIISREPMLVCGQPWVTEVFNQINLEIKLKWHVGEGDWLNEPATLCTLKGPAASILTAERTALNFLQTLSATATKTYRYVKQLEGTQARLLDTRKTIPGLRIAQKYAVNCGGGSNHRMGLYDAFLIKENHIKACGSIGLAVAEAKRVKNNLLIEVEVETLAELTEAIAAGPDRILLDNFNEEQLIQAVAMNHAKQCELEASGGININNLAKVAKTGVDYISIGAITKSIDAIDLSLLIKEAL